MRRIFLSIAVLVLLSSCAKSYRKLEPNLINYSLKKTLKEGVDIYYVYDIQFDRKNYRYSKREKMNNLALLAVKITNNSGADIKISQNDLIIKTNQGVEVPILSLNGYTKHVRQKLVFYPLYGILGLGVTTTYMNGSSFNEVTFNPFFLGIGLGNMIWAAAANQRQREHLIENQIFDKVIPTNSSLTGFIAIPENNYPSLDFILYK